MPPRTIIYTSHATIRLRQRAIDPAEIEYALDHAYVEMPGKNPGTTRIIADMALGRKLGVIFKRKTSDVIVLVTAYWVEGQP